MPRRSLRACSEDVSAAPTCRRLRRLYAMRYYAILCSTILSHTILSHN